MLKADNTFDFKKSLMSSIMNIYKLYCKSLFRCVIYFYYLKYKLFDHWSSFNDFFFQSKRKTDTF